MKREFTQTIRVENADGTFVMWCLLHDNTLDIWEGTTCFEINTRAGNNIFFADRTDWILLFRDYLKSKGKSKIDNLSLKDIDKFIYASKVVDKYPKEAKKEFIQLVKRAKILGMI